MSLPSEEERDKALLEGARGIPITWTCVDCGRAFDSFQQAPYALREREGKNGNRVRVGDVCKECAGE